MPDPITEDDAPHLMIRKGVLFYGDMPVGRMDGQTLVLNLGWTTIAGLSVRLMADPEVERPRGGVVFER